MTAGPSSGGLFGAPAARSGGPEDPSAASLFACDPADLLGQAREPAKAAPAGAHGSGDRVWVYPSGVEK